MKVSEHEIETTSCAYFFTPNISLLQNGVINLRENSFKGLHHAQSDVLMHQDNAVFYVVVSNVQVCVDRFICYPILYTCPYLIV